MLSFFSIINIMLITVEYWFLYLLSFFELWHANDGQKSVPDLNSLCSTQQWEICVKSGLWSTQRHREATIDWLSDSTLFPSHRTNFLQHILHKNNIFIVKNELGNLFTKRHKWQNRSKIMIYFFYYRGNMIIPPVL